MEEGTSMESPETETSIKKETQIQEKGPPNTGSQESLEIVSSFHGVEPPPVKETANLLPPTEHEKEKNPPSPKSTREKTPVVRFGTDESPIQKKTIHIKPGRGLKLGEIAAIDEQISKRLGNDDIIKGLHRLLFGLPGEVSLRNVFFN
jgi:hypothetical protein